MDSDVLKVSLTGAATSMCECLASYPTEYVKTQLQLSHGGKSALKSVQYRSSLEVIKDTWARFGFFGFYRGIPAYLFFAFPRGITRFTTFETAASALDATGWWPRDEADATSDAKYPLGVTVVAGMCAGLVEGATCIVPMTTIQVRLTHDRSLVTPRFKGFFHGVGTLIREGGPMAIYQGVAPTLLKVMFNQAVRFTLFEQLKRKMLAREGRGADSPAHLTTAESMLAGGTAGMVSVLANHPIDVIKSSMQGLEAARYRSIAHCFRTILKEDGVKGLYKGLGPRLVRVFWEVSLVFTLYEKFSRLFDSMFVNGVDDEA